MVTDSPPTDPRLRRQFEASDQHRAFPLPDGTQLRAGAADLEMALESGDRAHVERAGRQLISILAEAYQVVAPTLTVLGARPLQVYGGHTSYELFGDYTPATQRMRVWMRTAVLGKVTSYRGLLNTLLHEFCHHLDMQALGYSDTPHTRGFYHRVDELYHHALATPAERRRPLHWIKQGPVWRIDWNRLRPTRS